MPLYAPLRIGSPIASGVIGALLYPDLNGLLADGVNAPNWDAAVGTFAVRGPRPYVDLMHPSFNVSGSTTTTTGSITSGTASLVVASASTFVIGQGIYVVGAGAAGATLETVIDNIVGTTVTLHVNAGTTVVSAATGHSDTAGITAALAVGATGKIYAPAGTYNISQISIPTNTWLEGAGRVVSVFKAIPGDTSTAVILIGGTTKRCKLSDLGVDGNKSATGTTCAGISLTSSAGGVQGHILDNVRIASCKSDGLLLGASMVSCSLKHVQALSNDGHGINVTNGTSDCMFEHCFTNLSGLNGFQVSGGANHFTNCGADDSGQIDATNYGDGWLFTGGTFAICNTLAGCWSQDNLRDGVQLTAAADSNNIDITISRCHRDAIRITSGTSNYIHVVGSKDTGTPIMVSMVNCVGGASNVVDLIYHSTAIVAGNPPVIGSAVASNVIGINGPLSIGSTVGGGTSGAIPYVSTAGLLAQDPTHLAWDPVTQLLTVSTGQIYFDSSNQTISLGPNNPGNIGWRQGQGASSGATGLVAIGDSALGVTTTGVNNIAIGVDALAANTTGYQQTAIGANALKANIGGALNLAIGDYALYSNVSGIYNLAIGSSALYYNTNNYNTGIGALAFANTVGGYQNVGVGFGAGYGNVSGVFNTAVGVQALYAGGDANGQNTAVGGNALTAATGYFNTAIGAAAALSLQDGHDNTIIGWVAGVSLVHGSGNILIGSLSGGVDVPAATTSNFLNIGGTLFGNLGAGSIGVGVQAPTASLHIWAGNTGVNSAPLKFDNGAPMTTAEAGAVEYNGTHRVTNASLLRYPIGGVLFDHFADANNGTTVETDLYADTLIASTFATNGDKLEAQYGGSFVGDVTSTQRLRAYFGGTLIFDSGALGIGVTTAYWNMLVTCVRESSSIVRCTVSLTTSFATLNAYAAYTKVTGLTLTNTQVLKITGQSAGASGASNQITAREGYVEFKPAA
jgi:hypothetical protein